MVKAQRRRQRGERDSSRNASCADATEQGAGDCKGHADAENDGHKASFVVGVLNRPIPPPGHLEQVHGDTQNQQKCDEQLSGGPVHESEW
jgi:hypothetical protein